MTSNIKKYKSTLIKSLLFILVLFIFIFPILRLLFMSFKYNDGISISNYINLLGQTRTLESIKNTIIIAFSSTLISLFLGGLFSFFIAYTNIKRKTLMELLVLLPFIIPSYIITLSWSNLLESNSFINNLISKVGLPPINIYSLGGIIIVLGICNVPTVYLITVNMLRKIPVDLELASRVSGYNKWTTLFKINLPQIMPSLISGSILSFLSAIDNFSVPAFLGISSGIPVLSTYIYEKAIGFGPSAFNEAATLSVILSTIAILGTIIQGLFIKKSSSLDSIKEDYSVRFHFTHRNRKIIEFISLGFLISINIIPILTMIASSFQKGYGSNFSLDRLSLNNYKFLLTNRGVYSSIANSVTLALIATAICILLGTIIAYLKLRKPSKYIKLAESSATLTYAIPGIVLALAMIFHWTEPLPGFKPNIYGTIKILIISYITRYLILQIKGSTTAILAIDTSLEEATMVCGQTKFKLWSKIIIPLIYKQVLSSSFLIFMSAMTELTLSSMLASAGTKTIGLTIFNYQQAGNYNISSAMSSLIVFIVLIGFMGSKLLNKKGKECK